MRRYLAIMVIITALATMVPTASAQLSAYHDRALSPQTVLGIPSPVMAPIAYGQVRVCSGNVINISPCTPLATVQDFNGNNLTVSGGNFGQVFTDVTGSFGFQCSPGVYTIQVAASASNTPQLNYLIACPVTSGSFVSVTGNNAFTGNNTFTNLNNICFGTTLTSINACNASFSTSSPGLTWIPSNTPATAFWSTPANGTAIIDTRFINDGGQVEGGLPFSHSHLTLDFHAGANDTYEANPLSGPIGLTIQAFADAGSTTSNGNAAVVGLASFVNRGVGSTRAIWSADFNVSYSTATQQATGVEIDMGDPVADDTSSVGVGLRVVSCCTHKSGMGIGLFSSNTNSQFNYGMQVNNIASGGIGIQIANNNLARGADILLVPPANDTNLEVVGRNVTNSLAVWWVDDSGNIVTQGLIQGTLFASKTANAATTGLLRIANTDKVCSRNAANTADDCYGEIQTQSAAGCTTSGGATPFTGPCTVTVTWPSAFADANYRVSCVGIGIGAGVPLLQGLTGAPIAASVTVQTQQATGVNASFTTIQCSGIHQ